MRTVEPHTQSRRGGGQGQKCSHRWQPLGAHTLHVGHADQSGMAIREIRLVKRCEKCHEFKVSISRHSVNGFKRYNEIYTTPGSRHRRPPAPLVPNDMIKTVTTVEIGFEPLRFDRFKK